jgi:hypothetical protein
MSKPKTKNDIAWEKLFEKYHVLDRIEKNGSLSISAKTIKEFREPRLMAKFDHRINLPQIFEKNRLAILPISRGDYVISHFDAYHTFENAKNSIQYFRLPDYIQSLSANNISSETVALNCALASGMLSDFLEEEQTTLLPTVCGRMGSGAFSFKILNKMESQFTNINVHNSQIEIDAAIEGIESLTLFEAKNDISDDFLIRQLYYPYRVWKDRVIKKVRPVFMMYTNGVFRFYEYKFTDSECYNSLYLVKQKNYTLETPIDTNIELPDLMEILDQITDYVPEPKIPFPQADVFERVINLCELLQEGDISRQKVTDQYAFDIRQANYYSDAGRYLGLIDKYYESGRKPVYTLSEFGKQVMNMPYKKRQLTLCRQILQHKVFNQAFRLCESGDVPNKPTIIQLMKQGSLYGVKAEETFLRRSSTISGWINWMIKLLQKDE